MIKRFYLVLAFLLLPHTAMAKSDLVIAIYDKNPWLMAIGSDSPIFALYEDGKAIFWDQSQGQGKYRYLILDDQKVRDAVAVLHNLKDLAPEYPEPENDTIALPSDLATARIQFSLNNVQRSISVYGGFSENNTGVIVPSQLYKVYQYFMNHKSITAQVWYPPDVEIMVWPFEYAKNSISWPQDWPDLNSASTYKWGGDSYSIYLPYENLEAFKSLESTGDNGIAVEINGRKWAASYRIPFPHELR
ncbi:hypothetical protein [Kiloniella sp.]|uniref:hypothetical protein n=1 Tax=Kiloniella sp. TaxID=1938587 RepID=UPI003B02A075